MTNMLKRIDPKITSQEAQAIFEKFDANNDGLISFFEFSGLL